MGERLKRLARQLKWTKGVRVDAISILGVNWLVRPNHLFPPFDNPSVRRALLVAIDQSEFMSAVSGTDPSRWRASVGFFPPDGPLASTAGMSALAAPPNFDRARKDLAAAGYRGERVALMVPADIPTIKAMGDVTADLFGKAGLNLDYQSVDLGTMVQRRASKKPPAQGGWNLFCTGFANDDMMDPGVKSALRCNGEHAWFGWSTSPEIERLRDAWLDATELTQQKTIADAIQTQGFVDIPYFPAGASFPSTALRAELTGMLKGHPLFWSIRRG